MVSASVMSQSLVKLIDIIVLIVPFLINNFYYEFCRSDTPGSGFYDLLLINIKEKMNNFRKLSVVGLYLLDNALHSTLIFGWR